MGLQSDNFLGLSEETLNELLNFAAVQHFYMDKYEFRFRFMRMLKRIKEKVEGKFLFSEEEYIQTENKEVNIQNIGELKEQLTIDEFSKEMEQLQKINSLIIKSPFPVDQVKNRIVNQEWCALAVLLYFEEIYANDWYIAYSYPTGFREGNEFYNKYKYLFDKKTEFLKKCNLKEFIKEQISYFGFFENPFTKGNSDYIQNIIEKANILDLIPRDYLVKICECMVSDVEKYRYGLPEIININNGECHFYYEFKQYKKSKTQAENWLIKLIDNEIPVNIIKR